MPNTVRPKISMRGPDGSVEALTEGRAFELLADDEVVFAVDEEGEIVVGGGGGSGELLHKRVTLTSADILALNDTPIEVVTAVPGVAHLPISIMFIYRAGATPYVISDSDVYLTISTTLLRLVSLSDGWGEHKCVGFMDSASDKFMFAPVNANGGDISGFPPSIGDPSLIMGQALIVANDRDCDYTDGNGTVDVDVWYVEVEE